MKKKISVLLFAAALAAAPATADDNDGVDSCDTNVIQKSPNIIISILSFPFKVAVAVSYPVRCALDSIPKNK